MISKSSFLIQYILYSYTLKTTYTRSLYLIFQNITNKLLVQLYNLANVILQSLKSQVKQK